MPQISKYVRDALRAQLSSPGTGYNDRLAVIAGTYGIDAWQIDWSADSTGFLFGQIDPSLLERSSAFEYPLLTIDTQVSRNANRVKFVTFSGFVVAIIDIHHSWPQESVLADFASYLDASEDAVVACLNDRDTQNGWPANLLWNGGVNITRGGVRMGGLGWLQSLRVACQFELQV